MFDRLRSKRPSHAVVVAYLALFVALGGTSFAALQIGSGGIRDNSVRSRDLRNNDVRGKDIRNGTLTGRDVREATLGPVPRALNSDRVGGLTADALKVRCPAGTTLRAGVCLETTSATAAYAAAATTCKQRGRRLPLYPELQQLAQDGGGVSAAGEWTASVFESRTTPGQLDTVLVTGVGGASFARAGGASPRAFRCAAVPSN